MAPKSSPKFDPASRVAVVLAGGAARGAYEVGVVQYVLREVTKTLGRSIPLDILCGTSVGAINACTLAAHADQPEARGDILAKQWTELRIDRLLRANTGELLAMVGGLIGKKPSPPKPGEVRRGGLVDPSGIEEIVRNTIPFEKIRGHIDAGRLRALTISTTDVASGRTVIFLQREGDDAPVWSRDPTIEVRAATITAEHALASAAVPFFFPAVRLGDDFYCDGGLRQNVPLSPARRLGADALLVINPRYIGPVTLRVERQREANYPGPLFLLGKALNALLLDRIDNDIDRLQRINEILSAGTKRYGDTFVDDLNAELGDRQKLQGIRPLRVVHVRASRDIGAMAGAYVNSKDFSARAPGVIGKLLRRMGEWEGAGEADLLSYLLFDGEFAAMLIELGVNDARARHDELCAMFEEVAPKVAKRKR